MPKLAVPLTDLQLKRAKPRDMHRLQRQRGEKQSVRHRKARGEQFGKFGKSPANIERLARARRAGAQLLGGYGQLARALAKSGDPEGRKLAIGNSAH
jgi:hypothetical protein